MLREAELVLQTAVKLESEHGLMDEDKQTAVKYFTFAEVWYKFRLNQCTVFRFTIVSHASSHEFHYIDLR
jgi:hypothetical protein